MNPAEKSFLLLKELGAAQLAENLAYRLQIMSGCMERLTPAGRSDPSPSLINFSDRSLFSFDWVKSSTNAETYIAQADEIAAGRYFPFGGGAETLDFSLPQPLQHWTRYGDTLDSRDIKCFWEPARFTWAIPLCIAYSISKDEKYPAAFWKYFESFIENNPINLGPNWSSGQEVALRLIPWTMAGEAFVHSTSSTPDRKKALSDAIWQHCSRIPPSLHYARSQHNNHLLSEALGLMLGGWLFKTDSRARRWFDLGMKEFNAGILNLVDEDGTFSQHSTNYHRMLLHLSLIFQRIVKLTGVEIPDAVNARLAAATWWLVGQMDLTSGHASNLGHNDGTNLLPIGINGYSDYRPTLQAASCAFLGSPCLPPGNWDDLSGLLDLKSQKTQEALSTPATHRIGNEKSWASLRVCTFHSRPAHADLLHTELWLNGENLAIDAGTFAYNFPAPWDNSLSRSIVHNTVTVNGQDQMVRAGKFLWLKRVDATLLEQKPNHLTASISVNHDHAYTHIRKIEYIAENQFEVIDDITLLKKSDPPLPVTIQWLLPDWKWSFESGVLHVAENGHHVQLGITASSSAGTDIDGKVSLIRAGEPLIGERVEPIRGWVSNTYLIKIPALSFAVEYLTDRQIQIKSIWKLQ